MSKVDLVRFLGRQKGIEHQMKINGKQVMVYDSMSTIPFIKLGNVKGSEGLWGITADSDEVPILKESPTPYLVAGYFEAGKFKYCCMGEDSSDSEYAILRVSENKIDKIIQHTFTGADGVY